MGMFKRSDDMMKLLWEDSDFMKLEMEMGDMKIPHISRIGPFLGGEEGRKNLPPSVPETKELVGCIKDAIEGIKNLDYHIKEVSYLRGMLVEKVLEMRNAYTPPGNMEAVSELKGMDSRTSEDDVRAVVSKILGYDVLPGSFVGVHALEFRCGDFAGFGFGVYGKPTRVQVIIPAETDYARDHEIPYGEEELARFSVADLENRFIPEIKMGITLGAVSECGNYFVDIKDMVSITCLGFEELSEKVRNVLCVDVRDKFEKRILDIADVKDVDDFIYWRALRSADAAAERNTRR